MFIFIIPPANYDFLVNAKRKTNILTQFVYVSVNREVTHILKTYGYQVLIPFPRIANVINLLHICDFYF